MRRAAPLSLVLAALVAAGTARAGEIGHYAGGLMNIRDLAVPEPGLYGALSLGISRYPPLSSDRTLLLEVGPPVTTPGRSPTTPATT